MPLMVAGRLHEALVPDDDIPNSRLCGTVRFHATHSSWMEASARVGGAEWALLLVRGWGRGGRFAFRRLNGWLP